MNFTPSNRQVIHKLLTLFFVLVVACLSTFAQNTIQTIAGGGVVSGSATGQFADIAAPSSVTEDTKGNVYVSAPAQNQIYMISPSGAISLFAGIGYPSEDPQKLNGGPATQGTLNNPTGLATDRLGNIFIADTTDYLVRKVTAKTGAISDIAGNAHQCQDPTTACGDGGFSYNAYLGAPTAVATDKAGNVYIADTNDNKIRVVNETGVPITIFGVQINPGNINTIAGNGNSCSPSTAPCGDGGPALSAMLNSPNGIALDSAGNVYVADTGDRRIREITTAGTISTYAGTGNFCAPAKGCGDGGPATSANISAPWQISFDLSGNLYITDPPESKIREVLAPGGTNGGTIQTFAGDGTRGFAGDGGAATSAELNSMRGVWADKSGNILIADTGNARVRIVNSTLVINTLAGGGNGGDSGAATSAILAGDRATAIDGMGNVYIADTANNRIREISSATGDISTIAGTGIATYTGDGGPATAATLSNPEGVAVDNSGNVYIADSGNFVIREIDASGNINTVAGTGRNIAGNCGGSGATATSTPLMFPTTVAPDALGDFYIADQYANEVCFVSSGGQMDLFAGDGAKCASPTSPCGDTGPATSAQLLGPFSAVPDAFGNVYIADTDDNRIRVVNSSGTINAFAFTGNGILYGPNKNPALQFAYNTPQDLTIDPSGDVYVAGSGLYYTIERIDAKSPGNPTVAVTGRPGDPKYYGFLGDGGLAVNAELDNYGASIDGSGHLYVADGTNNRVREIWLTPSAGVAPNSLTFPATALNTTSQVKTFTLNNGGSDDLNISSINISGPFQLTSQTPCNANQVAPSIPCTIGVTFTPTTYGPASGKVIINDNAYQSPSQTVYVAGSGPDFSISANPTSLTVTHGQQGTSTITLTPAGGFNQTVTLTCTGAPKQSTCAIMPNSITLDGTDAATATLTISTGNGTPPGSYTLVTVGNSVTKHGTSIKLTVQ